MSKELNYNALADKKGKEPILSPLAKNFIFSAFKISPGYRKAQKGLGKILTVSFDITPERMKVLGHSADKKDEIEFSPEEKKKFLKIIQFNEEKVKLYKYIFVVMDMKHKMIYIENLPIDGRPKNNFEI